MKIGLISDTHDNLGALKAATRMLVAADIQTLIHCGDLTSARIAAHLKGFQVIYVSGNMDPSLAKIRAALKNLNPENFAGVSYTGMLDGVKIAATHGHIQEELARLIQSGEYAYVFHGHTHRRRDEMVGRTRVINPGALGGIRYEPRTICVLNLTDGTVRSLQVANY